MMSSKYYTPFKMEVVLRSTNNDKDNDDDGDDDDDNCFKSDGIMAGKMGLSRENVTQHNLSPLYISLISIEFELWYHPWKSTF